MTWLCVALRRIFGYVFQDLHKEMLKDGFIKSTEATIVLFEVTIIVILSFF